MIKLPLLLLPFSLLYAKPAHFLLPDEHSGFVRFLSDALSEPDGTILLLTPALNHPALKKALLKWEKKGTSIVIVAQQTADDPLSLVQYRHVNLYTYTARPLKGSVILIGERLVCTLSESLEAERLSQNASLARCSDDAAEIAAHRAALTPLLKRSKKYLK